VLGVNEAVARMPAALFAVGFVVLFGWQTRRLFPGEAARYSVPMLLSSLGWISFGRAATMEMLFTATFAASLGFMALWLWQGRRRWLFGFHGMLALSVLAKGFGGVLLAALILTAYCAMTRDWRWLIRVLHPGAVTFFAVIALPWMGAMWFRHGRLFFDDFIIKQHIRRVISNELAHPGPWWYYLPILLVGLFPWTAHLVLLRWRGLMADHRRVFLFCWAAVVLVFFSVSLGKLPGYILVAVPALVMWISEEWKRATLEQIRAIGIAQAVMLVALSVLLESLPIALSRGLSHAEPHFTALSGWLGAAGLLLIWLCWRGRRFGATLVAATVTTAIMVWILAVNAPEIDRTASARPIALAVCATQFGVVDLRRQLRYGLEFYCDRAMIDSAAMEYTLSPQAPAGAFAEHAFPEAGLTLWRKQ
jgi:4-amino-4-deoxy-L-arabinose transferase-like glycosyltransferase